MGAYAPFDWEDYMSKTVIPLGGLYDQRRERKEGAKTRSETPERKGRKKKGAGKAKAR